MLWLYYLALLIVLFTGLFAVILSLPGIWLMIAGTIAYAALTGWAYVGYKSIIFLVLIGIVAEVVETVAGGAGAKREGASRRGILAAVIGGILGGIFLTFLIPIPVLGTIIGACLGSLLAATIVELMVGKELQHSLRIGVGAFKGRFLGILSKLAFGLLILIITAFLALPIGGTPPTTPAAASPPSAPTLTGKLRNDIAAIGAETTGWAIEDASKTLHDIDVTAVQTRATPLVGHSVTLRGRVATTRYVERGPTTIFIADQIDAAAPVSNTPTTSTTAP
jgi:uncharacterized protein YqgC (DUF456 family)